MANGTLSLNPSMLKDRGLKYAAASSPDMRAQSYQYIVEEA
jgi:hypothetical protein